MPGVKEILVSIILLCLFITSAFPQMLSFDEKHPHPLSRGTGVGEQYQIFEEESLWFSLHFDFEVNKRESGSLNISVSWTDPSDNVWLYLYNFVGELVIANETTGLNVSSLYLDSADPEFPLGLETAYLKIYADSVLSDLGLDLLVESSHELTPMAPIQGVISSYETKLFFIEHDEMEMGTDLFIGFDFNSTVSVRINLITASENFENFTTTTYTDNSVRLYYPSVSFNLTVQLICYNDEDVVFSYKAYSSLEMVEVEVFSLTGEISQGQELFVQCNNNRELSFFATLIGSERQAQFGVEFLGREIYLRSLNNLTLVHEEGGPPAGMDDQGVLKIIGNSIPGGKIGFTIHSSYQLTLMDATFEDTLMQGQSKWYEITSPIHAGPIEIKVNWTNSVDYIEMTIFDTYNFPFTVERTTEETSETIIAYTNGELSYLRVYGNEINSDSVISYTGQSSAQIRPITDYHLVGQADGVNGAWLQLEVPDQFLPQMIEVNVMWDDQGAGLVVELLDEYGYPFEATVVYGENTVSVMFYPFTFEQFYTIHIMGGDLGNTTQIGFDCYSNVILYPVSDEPLLSGVSPGKGGNTGTIQVMLLGANFPANTTVSLVSDTLGEIMGHDTVVLTPNKALTSFDLTGAFPGTYSVQMRLPNGTNLRLEDAFVIQAGGGVNLWLTLTGRSVIRAETFTDYLVTWGNKGSVDIYDVFIWVEIPKVFEYEIPSLHKLPGYDNLAEVGVSFPICYNDEDTTYVLFWVDKVGAFSSDSFKFLIKGNVSLELQEFGVSVLLVPPSDNNYSRTGDIEYLEESSNLYPFLMRFLEHYEALEANSTNVLLKVKELSGVQGFWSAVGGYLKKAAIGGGIALGLGLAGAFVGGMIGLYAIAAPTLGTYLTGAALGFTLGEAFSCYYLGYCPFPSNPKDLLLDAIKYFWPFTLGKAVDPNEKIGASSSGYIKPNQRLHYTIYFENLPNATLGAATINITDQLSQHLDWSTLEVVEVNFANRTFTMPKGIKDIDFYWHRADLNASVEVEFSTNIDNGLFKVNMAGYELGSSTDILYDGFLQPNVVSPLGEGHILFLVDQKPDLNTGTNITNQASIVFDNNQPILTNIVTDNVDGENPISAVFLGGFNQTDDRELTLVWNGTDNGSKVVSYTIFVSVNGSGYVPLMVHTNQTSIAFLGEYSTSYSFYSVAYDAAGNFENKTEADLTYNTMIKPEITTSTSSTQTTELTTSSGGTTTINSSTETNQGGEKTTTDANQIFPLIALILLGFTTRGIRKSRRGQR